jgi:hypothetical protein
METKHTPGPWAKSGSVIRGIAGSERKVADVQIIDGEGQANAKLIAASPDLLESLTNLVGLAKLGAARLDKYHAALATAEAAIAKATA